MITALAGLVAGMTGCGGDFRWRDVQGSENT